MDPLTSDPAFRTAAIGAVSALGTCFLAIAGWFGAMKWKEKRSGDPGPELRRAADKRMRALEVNMASVNQRLAALEEAQREDRDETQGLRAELAEFIGRYESDSGWIKASLMRLEGRR